MLRWIPPSALILALIPAVLVAVLPLATAHADEPPSVHDVASGLMCQCGCGMTVAACQEAMSCSIAGSLVQEIGDQIDEGKSKGEILDYFATIYGEEFLGAPRKSGFGLTAWVTPFLAVTAGAVVAGTLVWFWATRRLAAMKAAAAPATGFQNLDLYEQRVDEDLRLLSEEWS